AEHLAEEFPTFGASLGGDGCAHWPVPPLREPAPIAAEGAGPIVVIGTTGDPATPYAWSESLAAQLDDAVLLTFEGNGHTAYGRPGSWSEAQVDEDLLEGTVPEDGLTCWGAPGEGDGDRVALLCAGHGGSRTVIRSAAHARRRRLSSVGRAIHS